MANNADLLVVGAVEGVSAAELTQRLIKEFGQPAEAFAELVAAACQGGAKYAAQTGVTLDTAVEGQAKLEDLGVICELVVDGEVVPSSGLSRGPSFITSAATATQEPQEPPQPEPATESQPSPDQTQAAAPAQELTQTGPEPNSEQQTDSDFTEATAIDAPDEIPSADGKQTAAVDELPDFDDEPAAFDVEDNSDSKAGEQSSDAGFNELEVSFDEELDTLGAEIPSPEVSGPESSTAQADEGEVSFDDVSFDIADDAALAAAANTTSGINNTPLGGESAADESIADSLADTSTEAVSGNPVEAPEQPVEVPDSPAPTSEMPAVEQDKPPSGGGLELSLSTDHDTPLTKPKEKTGVVPDIGGLSLVSDDDAPASVAAPTAAKAPVDVPDEPIAEPPATSVESQPAAAADQTPLAADDLPDTSTPSAEEAPEPQVQSRDTSREPVEVIPPVIAPDEAEPEPEPLGDNEAPKKDDAEPPANLQDPAIAAEQTQPAESADMPTELPDTLAGAQNDALAALESLTDPIEAPAPAENKNDISSFIDSLVADIDPTPTEPSGGLVLPGQEAEPQSQPQPLTQSELPPQETVESAESSVDLGSITATGEPPEAEVENTRQPVSESFAPEITNANDSDVFVVQQKRKRLAMAAAGIGVLGVGALVAMQTGLINLSGGAQVPQVAVVAPADDAAELDAVAQVSLNAALERSKAPQSPDNFSTEELIAYLAKDLGESARRELRNYVSGETSNRTPEPKVPVLGAAIPADSDSEMWLRNRVQHRADKYFDQWSKRDLDLQAYLELQERMIEGGDLQVALEISSSTKDKLFSVMSLQRLARAFDAQDMGDEAREVLDMAVRGTYAIDSEEERVIAIADFAATENELGLADDSADSFLKASILARSIHEPEAKTVAFTTVAEYFYRGGQTTEALDFLNDAMEAALGLPMNTAVRDLAIRHVALTEARLGMTEQATDHANMIIDPFAAVSTLHGIALELERTGDEKKARLTLNMAYRAGSLISDSNKREILLEKIKLAGN